YGNGDGTLQPCVTLASEPLTDFTVADVDHDGMMDVIGWNQAGSLLYYRGTHSSLMSPVTLAQYENRMSYVVADLNGDQRLDVVVQGDFEASTGKPTVVVFLGQPGGGFSTSPPIPLGGDAVADDRLSNLTAWDFDHDGHLDVIAAISTRSGVRGFRVMKGDGHGSLQTAGPTLPGGGAVVADFDHDGYPDSVSSFGGLTVSFGSASGWASRQTVLGLFEATVIAQDVAGDGFADLLLLSRGTLVVLRNRGDGNFSPPVAWFSNINGNGFAMGDLTGDGLPDLVIGGVVGSNGDIPAVLVVRGLTGGRFDAVPALIAPSLLALAGGSRSSVSARLPVFPTDVDHDGHVDLVVGPIGKVIEVFRSRGDGTFEPWRSVPIAVQSFTSEVSGDFDGDGNLDIAVSTPANFLTSVNASIFFGNRDGTFKQEDVILPSGVLWPVARDFFHEGRAQLVVINFSRMKVINIRRGVGVDAIVEWPAGNFRGFCDIDGDGLLDVAGDMMVKNQGRMFCTVPPSQFAPMTFGGNVADIDGDGRP
ncbi:MAG: FG-GAP repeat domain-containing protein, partial [Thermoanaerobaculia bacterium]